MATTVYLIRNGETDWTRERRLCGRRDVGLSSIGRAQADALAKALAATREVQLTEVLCSPLPRAVETAERIAAGHRLEVARDPRLTNLHAGIFEGKRYSELETMVEYQRFLAQPVTEPIPGGERLVEVRDRIVASLNQSLRDNELGAHIALVSHAAPIRLALAHFLGMELAAYGQLHVHPASLTVLRFESDTARPRLMALGWTPDLAPQAAVA